MNTSEVVNYLLRLQSEVVDYLLRLQEERHRMKAALVEVERWWLEEGRDQCGVGAPACIFTVRQILAEIRKTEP